MKRVPVDRGTDGLLVIDVQNDFCSGGTLEIPRGEEVVPIINSLIPRFGLIVLTQDWHPKGHLSFASSHAGHKPFEEIELAYGRQILWPDHCVQGTRGADFHPLLLTHAARLILRKGTDPAIDSYSAFFENDRRTATGLGQALQEIGVRRLFLTGLALDVCVRDTALDGRRIGFEVVLVEDACRATALEGSAEQALADMTQAGVARAKHQHLT